MSEIITINEARKLLGKDGESLSDDQILEMVGQLEVIASWAIKDYLTKTRKDDQDLGHSDSSIRSS